MQIKALQKREIPLRKNSGFTLVEIMMALGIMGLIGLGILNFDIGKQSDGERVDRLAQGISSALRFAKTSAVSGRTTVETTTASWGCADYVIQISERSITGTAVDFSETGSIAKTCGTIPEASLSAPFFGDPGPFMISAITAYDTNGNSAYRIANSSDYGGNSWTLPTGADNVAVFINGSNLSAYPANCGTPSCADTTNQRAVVLKFNASYNQWYGLRDKKQSKDVFFDLRTGNISITGSVAP